LKIKSVSSHFFSSALFKTDWRMIQQLIKSVIKKVIDLKVHKLNNMMKKLTTDVVLLKAENKNLQ